MKFSNVFILYTWLYFFLVTKRIKTRQQQITVFNKEGRVHVTAGRAAGTLQEDIEMLSQEDQDKTSLSLH